VLILAIGSTVYPSLEAAHMLSEHSIGASVINCRFVKPLDKELICPMAERLGKVLTVEENVLDGGFGSAVLELFQERGLSWVRVRRIGIPDRFVEHGQQETLRGMYSINKEGIAEEAREMVLGVQRERHGAMGFGKGIVLK
jgi:1-deoxy-D-xylulose-5-phosphate synthase